MMETFVKNVADFNLQDRSALERLIGRPLKDDQQLIIQIVGISEPPAQAPDADQDDLPDWCRVYEGLSDEAIDAIDESIVRTPTSRDVP